MNFTKISFLKGRLTLVAIALIIVSPISYIIYTKTLSDKLHKNGIGTQATVGDLKKYRNPRTRTLNYEATLSYEDSNGNRHKTSIAITQNEFDKFFVGESVSILMDQEDPKSIILVYDQTIKGEQERILTVDDLLLLIEAKGQDTTLSLLKGASKHWRLATSNVYVNEVNENFLLVASDSISYVTQLRYESETLEKLKALPQIETGQFYPKYLPSVPFESSNKTKPYLAIPFTYTKFKKGDHTFKVHNQLDSTQKSWVVLVCRKMVK